MDLNVVITGGVGILASIISGWASWFFTRKKYDAEVDHTLVENMEDSLEFYQKLADDNARRLEELLKRNEILEKEVLELKHQVSELMLKLCVNIGCNNRKTKSTAKSSI